MKNKKVLIIVGIIVVIAVAVVSIITMSSGSIPGIGSISRDIKYINEKGGKDNKLAYLMETTTTDIREHSIVAITVDDDFIFTGKKGYYDDEEREDDEINIEINHTELDARTYGGDDIIEIDNDIYKVEEKAEYPDWGEIVKHDENWLLTKKTSTYGSPSYRIWYAIDNDWKITNPNEYSCENGAFYMTYGTSFFDDDQKAISAYEHLKSVVKVYKVKNTDESSDDIDFSKVEYIDAKGNVADLSDYQFARDIIAKSLEPYGIYLRNHRNIGSDGYGGRICYMVAEKNNSYIISLATLGENAFEENEYKKLVDKFNRNGREYIVMEEYSILKVYTQEKDNLYVCIETQIYDEDPAPFVQEIKDNIL